MLSIRYSLFALLILAGCASAQWSPGGQMAYVGDLTLAGSSFSAESAASGGSADGNNRSANATLVNQTLPEAAPGNTSSEEAAASLSSPAQIARPDVLDLSAYSRDRANKNLAGYKNIMYPISESRGSTASTAGGGSGCGCG